METTLWSLFYIVGAILAYILSIRLHKAAHVYLNKRNPYDKSAYRLTNGDLAMSIFCTVFSWIGAIICLWLTADYNGFWDKPVKK
jgi:hypothetical protein